MRQINRITYLKDEHGNKLTTHIDIEHTLVTYFKESLIETKKDRLSIIQLITKNIPKVVFEEHNEALLRQITMEELEQTIMDMPKGKSLGLDSFTKNLFQSYWYIIKKEVLELMEESRNFLNILSSLNATFLSLITKEKKYEDPSKFRPISLCNIV